MNETLRKDIAEDKRNIESASSRLSIIQDQRRRMGIPKSSVVYSSEEQELENYIEATQNSIEDVLNYASWIESEYELDE